MKDQLIQKNSKSPLGKRITVILILLLCTFSILTLFTGVVHIRFSDILSGNTDKIHIVLISRLPRLIAILLTGMGMSIAGMIMQQLCMNKFVSPTTGSTIASAQFGILISLIFWRNMVLVGKTLISFIFAMAGTYIFIYFMQKMKYKDKVLIPLVGIMFGNILAGLTGFLAYKYDLSQAVNSWLVGDFSLILKGKYEIVYITFPLIVIAFLYANYFNIAGMGENFSKNLGVNYNFILIFGISIAAMITSSIVVVVGSVPYIGLIIPNIVSIIQGDKLQNNLLNTSLMGALFVLVCDLLGRVINPPYEIPIQLTIGIIGSVIFIGMMYWQLKPKGAITHG